MNCLGGTNCHTHTHRGEKNVPSVWDKEECRPLQCATCLSLQEWKVLYAWWKLEGCRFKLVR